MCFSDETHLLFEHKEQRLSSLKEELSPRVCQIPRVAQRDDTKQANNMRKREDKRGEAL
jgi:hypothetical protein